MDQSYLVTRSTRLVLKQESTYMDNPWIYLCVIPEQSAGGWGQQVVHHGPRADLIIMTPHCQLTSCPHSPRLWSPGPCLPPAGQCSPGPSAAPGSGPAAPKLKDWVNIYRLIDI